LKYQASQRRHQCQRSRVEGQARGHSVVYCCHCTVDCHRTYHNALSLLTDSMLHKTNNSNYNNTNANLYGAIMTAEPWVHPVHLMNVEWRQVTADPQTKPNDLGCESTYRLPESTPTIAIYYYYSARKLILILPSHRGKKAEST